MIRVLSVASECAPLVKTGGLADVVGALPAALYGQGVEMRVLLPGYRPVMAALGARDALLSETDLFGGPARLVAAKAAGLPLLVLEAPHLFDRPGSIYLGADGRDWPDNPERFAALSFMAARIAAEGAGGWRPQVLHGHDWQAGLAPVYLDARDDAGGVASVLTIHNIAFHGFAPGPRRHGLRLPERHFIPDGYEYWGQVSALKAGLVFSDALTTVSPTYARELMTPQFGMGLEGVLAHRASALVGILNGIDTKAWNPAADPAVPAYKSPRGKAAAKAALLAETGLPEGEGPLCVVVSRLTEQKGLDLLLEALPALVGNGGRLALLGAGERALEARWRQEAARNPALSVTIGYDEALSHRMIAGGDAIVVPSRFEPCGLTQLYGLRYGTIPLVALTGGLADTVIAANPAALRAGVATGLTVHPITAPALAAGLAELCALYRDRHVWRRMQRNAMRQNVGWEASAAEYAALYERLLARA